MYSPRKFVFFPSRNLVKLIIKDFKTCKYKGKREKDEEMAEKNINESLEIKNKSHIDENWYLIKQSGENECMGTYCMGLPKLPSGIPKSLEIWKPKLERAYYWAVSAAGFASFSQKAKAEDYESPHCETKQLKRKYLSISCNKKATLPPYAHNEVHQSENCLHTTIPFAPWSLLLNMSAEPSQVLEKKVSEVKTGQK